MGALRRQRRACAESRGSAGAGRGIRHGGDGSGRYAHDQRAAHFDDFMVPPAPRRGAYAHGVAGGGAAALAKTCASLTLEMRRERAAWSGAPGAPSCARLLRGIHVHVERRKPVPAMAASFASRWDA